MKKKLVLFFLFLLIGGSISVQGNRFAKLIEGKKKYEKIYNDKYVQTSLAKSGKSNNYIYGIEEVNAKNKLGDKIAIISTKDKTLYKYETDKSVNGICADDTYIYYAYTEHMGKNTSYIARIKNDFKERRKDYREVEKIHIDDIVIAHINIEGKYIYAFGFDFNDKGVYSKMYIYDIRTLDKIKEVFFTDYIIDVTGTDFYNNKMYVAGRSMYDLDNGQGIEVDNKYICEVDLKSLYIRKIYVGDKSNDIMCTKDGILITNYDAVLDLGNKIYKLAYNNFSIKSYKFTEKVRDKSFFNQVLEEGKNK